MNNGELCYIICSIYRNQLNIVKYFDSAPFKIKNNVNINWN